jgi:hypothetical protein
MLLKGVSCREGRGAPQGDTRMKNIKPQVETPNTPATQPSPEPLKVTTRIKCGRRGRPFYGID